MNKQFKGKKKPNFNKNKFKKGSSNRNSGGYKKEDSETKMSDKDSDVNNPAYYYDNNTVLDQVMNFSFNQFGGIPIEMHTDSTNVATFSNPMIVTYALNPSIPIINPQMAGTFGSTTAALRNFIALSGSNAKTTNYAPQDVLLLEMALGEVLKMATWIARNLGCAYLFNYRNRDYPEQLYIANCVDPVDLKQNLAQYRVEFNKLLTLASKVPFPAAIPAFAKATSIYGSMYLDDDNSALAQTYMFIPYSTWVFNEAYNANGSGLTTQIVCDGTVKPLSFYLQLFENMISALLNSTTLNYIYSDVMRLVQAGKMTDLLKFSPIDENFTVVPTYNAEIETWLHNAIIVGKPLATADQHSWGGWTFSDQNDVSSDAGNNRIIYCPQFDIPGEAGYEALLDFDHDNVSVEERVRATRFATRWIPDKDSVGAFTTSIALSDHYIVSMNTYFNNGKTTLWNSYYDLSTATATSIISRMCNLTKFDWAPIVYPFSENDVTKCRPIGDLDYYTLLDYPVIRRMYDYEVIHYYQIG